MDHHRSADRDRDDASERHGHHEHGRPGDAPPVVFDGFDMTNYLHANNRPDGTFDERFIMHVNALTLNGATVDVPGLNTKFGLYFVVDATGKQAAGATTFDTMDVTIMVDRGNDDGPISATPTGIGFANGTAGDYALATGHFVSAKLSIDPATNARKADFVQAVTPTKVGEEVFGGSLADGALLRELLTTFGTNPPLEVGSGYTTVNGGIAVAQLSPVHALTLSPEELLEHHGGWCGGEGW